MEAKHVTFYIEAEEPKIVTEVSFNEKELEKTLRSFSQKLIERFRKKLELNQIESANDIDKYVVLIFQHCLKNFTQSQIKTIKNKNIKFPFLPHNDKIHSPAIETIGFIFLGLANGEIGSVESYTSPYRILYRDGLIEDAITSKEYTRSLCKKVAEFVRKLVEEFLQEFHKTGKIMTTDELAAQKAANVEENYSDEEFEPVTESTLSLEENYSDDEFESYTESLDSRSTPSSQHKAVATTASSSSAKNTNARAILKDTDEDAADYTKNKETVVDGSSELNALIDQLFAWFFEFPEFMQKLLSHIKELVNNLKKEATIYDLKSIEQDFTKKTLSQKTEESPNDDVTRNDTTAKPQVIKESDVANIIDMTMIQEKSIVPRLILPLAVESGDILEIADIFSGVTHFGNLDNIGLFFN